MRPIGEGGTLQGVPFSLQAPLWSRGHGYFPRLPIDDDTWILEPGWDKRKGKTGRLWVLPGPEFLGPRQPFGLVAAGRDVLRWVGLSTSYGIEVC